MDLKNVLERGAAIWAIAFALTVILFLFEIEAGIWGNLLRALVVLLVAYFFAREKGFKKTDDAFVYGLGWAVIFFLLDFFVTAHYFGLAFFQNLAIWAGYFLVLIAPLFSLKGGIKTRK